MELTEDMLRRIANDIADLRLRVSIVGHLVTQEIEPVVQKATASPDFQTFRNQIFEQLKGGH
jgi:hypothetical protein